MSISKTLRALNRYTARQVLDRLRHGPMSVRDIAATFKFGTRTHVSQALALLLYAGLVTRRREGRVHYYQVRAPGFNELVRYLKKLAQDAAKTTSK